ncbi:hypothetical protein MNB_SV-6-625 [hydrothermal vent metagenome]|uniref:Uncharacterized protein n=1 Tax=hydrothermal vent metagenome TaxID=652676 RepID=A0A1W1CCM8_9ZZZZ
MNSRILINIKAWIFEHSSGLILLISTGVIVSLVYFFGWWETIGILILKFGLGAKVAGAKTFAQAIIKAGGKKAIAVATAGMLAKRHIIDIISKFFAEHSVSRYKRNLTLVLKHKFEEIKNSSLIKKLKAIGSMLLSIPMVYFFWTKVLGTAIQKFIYALILPLVSMLWSLLLTSFSFLNFIFQVMMLNIFLDTISNYSIGKKIIHFIDKIIYLIGELLKISNYLLGLVGLHPKAWIIRFSNWFNRWLESILDRGLSPTTKLENHRNRYINIVESISEKRYIYVQSKQNAQKAYWREVKKIFERVVLKKSDWRVNRKKRVARWSREKQIHHKASKRALIAKREKRNALILPFHTDPKKSRKIFYKKPLYRTA